MIRMSNLSFRYAESGTPALDGLDLAIAEGESIGLLGANGSGKTTLVRCLNGLLLPTEGRVEVDGLNTGAEEDLVEIRRRVGMVFQNPENQIVSTTVESEIAFGLENLGLPHDEMHRVVDAMLEGFDLVRYRHHPPHLLSGGEMQRLALAAVMAMSPKYLVFDEPTSLLDPAAREMVLGMIADLHAGNQNKPPSERMATLLVTQYPEEVLGCDRLLVLHEGELVFDDAPVAVFENVDALHGFGVGVPLEFEVNHYLEQTSNGKFSLKSLGSMPIL